MKFSKSAKVFGNTECWSYRVTLRNGRGAAREIHLFASLEQATAKFREMKAAEKPAGWSVELGSTHPTPMGAYTYK